MVFGFIFKALKRLHYKQPPYTIRIFLSKYSTKVIFTIINHYELQNLTVKHISVFFTLNILLKYHYAASIVSCCILYVHKKTSSLKNVNVF